VLFRESSYTLLPGESVLDGLARHGVAIPSSCRAGTCQTCLVQATSGDVPAAAQAGLKETWKKRGYFMACVCRPEGELAVQPIGEAEEVAAEVTSVTRLSETVTRLRLMPERPLA